MGSVFFMFEFWVLAIQMLCYVRFRNSTGMFFNLFSAFQKCTEYSVADTEAVKSFLSQFSISAFEHQCGALLSMWTDHALKALTDEDSLV